MRARSAPASSPRAFWRAAERSFVQSIDHATDLLLAAPVGCSERRRRTGEPRFFVQWTVETPDGDQVLRPIAVPDEACARNCVDAMPERATSAVAFRIEDGERPDRDRRVVASRSRGERTGTALPGQENASAQ